jgi:hypothetical protein
MAAVVSECDALGAPLNDNVHGLSLPCEPTVETR